MTDDASAQPVGTLRDAIPAATLRWMLAGLLGAVLLNLRHTAPWCLPVALGGAAWRLWAAQHVTRLMGRSLRVVILVILTLAVLLGFRTLNGLDAGASLLVAMAALKLMETQRVRDWLIVLGAALFLLLAACLDAQDLWRAPFYAAELWLLCTALYALGAGAGVPEAKSLLRTSARSLLFALPLALLLFLFFPRLPGSLWAIPREDEAMTGLGDEMSPGSISQLVESQEPALHVRFEGTAPPLSQRYWRGPVLHEFDGHTWRRGRAQFGAPAPLEFEGRGYRYEVTLEPNKHHVLIALELPRDVPEQLTRVGATFDYELIGSQASSSAISYRLESFPQHRNPEGLPGAERAFDLALPPGRNPRSLELAHTLRVGADSDRAFIDAVLDYLRRGGFVYSLAPPLLGANSVDELLFTTREGFCGHYASAFATLMRAGGIPARVVTGYAGGEWNRFGHYLLVRQADAHAWTEVWVAGSGWVRVDPTAVVAPERLRSELDDAMGSSLGADRRAQAASWFSATVQAWQAVNAWWQDEFVNFNMVKQLNLLGALGLKSRDWETLVVLLAAGGTLWLAALAWRGRDRGVRRPSDGLGRAWRQLERKLRRSAAPRAPHEGPIAYCERVARARPELAATLAPLARQYAQLRYGTGCSREQLQRFRRAVRLFTPRIGHAAHRDGPALVSAPHSREQPRPEHEE
jgi:transglutaminase-like putative cysteine protease